MQNVEIRFVATGNFAGVQQQINSLTASAAALSATVNSISTRNATNNPILNGSAFTQASNVASAASSAFTRLANDSGVLRAQQVSLSRSTDDYTRSLMKQRLSLSELLRTRKQLFSQVLNDQLRMQRMTATMFGRGADGKGMFSITMPTNVPTDIARWNSLLGVTNAALASASTQMINFGKNTQWAGRQLTVGFTYPLTLLGGAASVMTYKVEDAFAKISKVYNFSNRALVDSGQLEKETNQLRATSMKNATDTAAKYGVQILDILDVQQQLAATGFDMSNGLLDMTNEVSRIAMLGDIDPSQTTEMIIALKTAFSEEFTGNAAQDIDILTGKLNFMNAASNASSLSLQDIAEAVPRVASSMGAVGGSIEDMVLLLTSMREGGVQAAEAANAVKSATSRIVSPVTAAVKYFQELDIDINAVSENSGGNLLKFLQDLAVEMEGLSKFEKTKGITKLFGTYQSNRLTASVNNLALAYAGVNNQSAQVLELTKKSNDELERMADISEKQVTSSLSAQLRMKLQPVLAELNEIGKPFLILASTFLGAVQKILAAINGLSDGAKKFLAIALGTAAVAGPILMLIGLFGNLMGWFLKILAMGPKYLGFLDKLAGGKGLLKVRTTEMAQAEAAAVAETMKLTDALGRQSKPVQTAAMEMDVLKRAMAGAAVAANAAVAAITAVGQAAARVQATPTMPGSTPFSSGPPIMSGGPAPLIPGSASMATTPANATYGMRSPIPQIVNPFVQSDLRRQVEASGAARRAMEAQARAAQETAQATQQTAGSLMTAAQKSTATAAAMGATALSAGIVASMFGQGDIAKYLIIGGLLVPILTSVIIKINEMAAAYMSAAAAATASAATQTAAASGLRTALGAAGAALRGPAGIATGIVLATSLFMVMREKAKKAEEAERRAMQARIDILSKFKDVAQQAASAVDATYTGVKKLDFFSSGNPVEEQNIQSRYDYYKNSEDGQKAAAAFMSDENGALTGFENVLEGAKDAYLNFALTTDMSSKQIATEVMAMMSSIGVAYEDQVNIISQLETKYADIRTSSKVAADALASDASSLASVINDKLAQGQVRSSVWDSLMQDNTDAFDKASADIKAQADKLGVVFNSAISDQNSPWQNSKIIDSLFEGSDDVFRSEFERLSQEIPSFMEAAGIDSVEKLKEVFRGTNGFKAEGWLSDVMDKAGISTGDKSFWQPFNDSSTSLGSALKVEDTIIAGLVSTNSELQGIVDKKQLLERLSSVGVFGQQDAKNALRTNPDFKNLENITNIIKEFRLMNGDKPVKTLDDLITAGKSLGSTFSYVNEQGRTVISDFNNTDLSVLVQNAERLRGNIGGIVDGLIAAEGKRLGIDIDMTNPNRFTYWLNNDLENMPSAVQTDVDVNVTGEEDLDALKAKLATVDTRAIASDIVIGNLQQAFDARQEAASRALEASQEAANRALEDRQEAASRAMEARHEAASERLQKAQEKAMREFERTWGKKRDEINEAYDERIKSIDKLIEKERKAQEQSDALYDAERERLQGIADMANKQIDLDVAINLGNFDEAAKLQNEMQATSISEQLDRDQEAQQKQTERLIERLEKRKEKLDKMRERELKKLEKEEERQRRVLERLQERQTKALEKMQERQSRALQRQQEAAQRALEDRQRAEQDAADDRVAMEEAAFEKQKKILEKYPMLTKQQFAKAMAAAGLELKDFNTVAANKSQIWAKTFKTKIVEGLADASNQIIGDIEWDKIGAGITLKTVEGLGFANLPQFIKFVRTGEMPPAKHSGGVVGEPGRRTGHTGGMGRDEQLINAKRGEFIVNATATRRHRALLERINKGVAMDGIGGYSGGVPVAMGWNMMMRGGMPKVYERVVKKKKEESKQNTIPGGGYQPGSGSPHKPISYGVSRGEHPLKEYASSSNPVAVDMAGPTGAPVYAVRSGVIVHSADIPGPLPTDKYRGDGPYGSFGRNIRLLTDSGDTVLYAHLSKRSVQAGKRVAAGAVIGYSGNTGNSSGPHLHFGATSGNPWQYLRNGGEIKYDDTPARLHKGETVLTQSLTRRFKDSVMSAGSGGDTFDIDIDLSGAMINNDVDIEKAVYAAIEKAESKRGRRRTVGR